jgi:hypothetical protein
MAAVFDGVLDNLKREKARTLEGASHGVDDHLPDHAPVRR